HEEDVGLSFGVRARLRRADNEIDAVDVAAHVGAQERRACARVHLRSLPLNRCPAWTRIPEVDDLRDRATGVQNEARQRDHNPAVHLHTLFTPAPCHRATTGSHEATDMPEVFRGNTAEVAFRERNAFHLTERLCRFRDLQTASGMKFHTADLSRLFVVWSADAPHRPDARNAARAWRLSCQRATADADNRVRS